MPVSRPDAWCSAGEANKETEKRLFSDTCGGERSTPVSSPPPYIIEFKKKNPHTADVPANALAILFKLEREAMRQGGMLNPASFRHMDRRREPFASNHKIRFDCRAVDVTPYTAKRF